MNRSFRRRFACPQQSTLALAALTITAVLGAALVMNGGHEAAPPVSQSVSGANGTPPNLPSRSHPAVLFIGDDYTQGTSTPDLSYGCLAATELGWECNIAAQPATGYLSGGPGQRLPVGEYGEPSKSFVEEIPRLRALYRADMVVIDGGRNDLQFDIVDLDRMFAYTVSQVIEAWPNSRIVVIAPWLLNHPVIRPPALAGRTIGDELRSVLRSSPQFHDVELVDPAALGWLSDTAASQYLSSDGYHPNAQGDKLISALLDKALTTLGVISPS